MSDRTIPRGTVRWVKVHDTDPPTCGCTVTAAYPGAQRYKLQQRVSVPDLPHGWRDVWEDVEVDSE